VRYRTAAADSGGERGEGRSARSGPGTARGDRFGEHPRGTPPLTSALEWGLIPAVPVPFRGRELADDALQAYASWMADHQVAGVAVWAHTGRGPYLSRDQRRRVLAAWRAALPMSPIVAGATFQRIAGLMRDHPGKLLITGEDRFLGYSLTMGARAALIGMGAALTDLQVALMESFRSGDFGKFVRLSGVCDRFASAT